MPAPKLLPLLDEPRRVDVWAIDRELADLWRAAAAVSEAERIVLSRARTLTLVLYAADPAAGARLADVAARTCQRHPGRAIVLTTDPAEPELSAEVTAICQIRRRDQKQVCCEQVLIQANPGAQDRLPSLVRQLVLPDMPVVVYWPAPPAAGPMFRELGEVADRVIVDTGVVANGPVGLLAAGGLAAQRPGHFALSDLTWGRITIWRGLTAHFFDPPATAALDRISLVRVAHAATSRTQGLLYLGWLVGRLHWRVVRPFSQDGGPWRATAADEGDRQIALSLHAEARAPHPAGALLSVLIATDALAGGQGGMFSIARNDDAGGVIATAEAAGGEPIKRALPLDPYDEASLLATEMDVLAHDRVYEESLRAVAALLGQG